MYSFTGSLESAYIVHPAACLAEVRDISPRNLVGSPPKTRFPNCMSSAGKKSLAKARWRKVNELTIFAPSREKFRAAIFLLLRFLY